MAALPRQFREVAACGDGVGMVIAENLLPSSDRMAVVTLCHLVEALACGDLSKPVIRVQGVGVVVAEYLAAIRK